jgi:hypothetical protein
MTKLFKVVLLTSAFSATALNAETTKYNEIEELLILGTKAEKQKLAGSGMRIDA